MTRSATSERTLPTSAFANRSHSTNPLNPVNHMSPVFTPVDRSAHLPAWRTLHRRDPVTLCHRRKIGQTDQIRIKP